MTRSNSICPPVTGGGDPKNWWLIIKENGSKYKTYYSLHTGPIAGQLKLQIYRRDKDTWKYIHYTRFQGKIANEEDFLRLITQIEWPVKQ